MANISDACGTIKLEGDWGKDEAIMLSYFIDAAWATTWDYGMYLPHDTLVIADKLLKGGFSFYGSGRWSFENTLKSNVRHLEPYGTIVGQGRTITIEEFNSMYLLLAKTMKEKDLQFTVEYADMEVGVGYLGEGYMSFESTGKYITETSYDFDEYEATLSNRIAIFNLTFEDVSDIMCSAFDGYEGEYEITGDTIEELVERAMDGRIDFPMSPYYVFDDDMPEEVLEVIRYVCG